MSKKRNIKDTTDFNPISPSPISVPVSSNAQPLRLTTDFPYPSPSPISVPSNMHNAVPKTVQFQPLFQPNLFYNKENDIHWYNNSPITESRFIWLLNLYDSGYTSQVQMGSWDRNTGVFTAFMEDDDEAQEEEEGIEKGVLTTYGTGNLKLETNTGVSMQINNTDIIDLTDRRKILYMEENDGTCWFKGHNIWCETYDILLKKQEKYTKLLKTEFRKPGLYYHPNDPLERYKGELFFQKFGEHINERDWEIFKLGKVTHMYKGFEFDMGTPAVIAKNEKKIDRIRGQQEHDKKIQEEFAFLRRAYTTDKKELDEINKNIVIFNELNPQIVHVTEDVFEKFTDTEKNDYAEIKKNLDPAINYLKTKMNKPDDYVVGGKKRKQTQKRKKSKRKTNKKRKRNTPKKSRKHK
jgi:hypothetical protein